MRENITTIPLIDAFKADGECPFCHLEREAEQHAISFILGSAYMEDDIREKTDATDPKLPETQLGSWISQKVNSCYVCDHFRSIYGRYLDTFFDLYLKNEEFRQMFENSKGFCLPHFGDLIETAENKLNDAQKKDFYAIAFPLMQENMERLQKEVSWFVEKNDYRNKDKDWGTSADSIQRGMQKCAGGFPADETFKVKL